MRNSKRAHFDETNPSIQDCDSVGAKNAKNMPSLFLKRKSRTPANVHGEIRRKSEIKLSDYGITFDKYKAELEQGIIKGFRPHFGFPVIRYNDIKEGLAALAAEDSNGVPDPMMSVVNSDSIEKFQNLLISTQNATVKGSTLVINENGNSN